MDLSIFPRGKYYAKQADITLKRCKSGKVYAIVIKKNEKNHATIWDIGAFRPDPVDFFEDSSSVTILYESVNYTDSKCHKIPRYIVTNNGKWIVNVR